ncbi:MAG TPA: FAD-binding oxidoreductase, partial [Actinomycetota bacterium]|nr:FAD-binding oxidoreductase [Actinomycetota bacterium]
MAEATLTTGTVDDSQVAKLKIEFQGEVLRPGDKGYDEGRTVYNGMFQDRKPAAILRCTNTDDVVTAVNFARSSGLLVAVKAGGHSIAGFSAVDGGIVIDLSLMRAVDVDPDAKTAKAQAGVTWAEFDAATAEHGLATPGGFVSKTGIAGLTLNGGLGLLSRKYGLSCDNLISAKVVTADGEVVHADETENDDLFWGLKGGGGNFGIVTEFVYKLHPVTDVFMVMAMYPADRGAEILRLYRDIVPTQPEELATIALFFTVPVNPMFPEELHGQKVFAIFAGFIGSEAEAQAHVGFIGQIPDPLLSMGMTVPYVMVQSMQDEDVPFGRQNYWKSGFLSELTDEVIDKIARLAPTAT